MTCGCTPVDLSPVRLALEQGDQAALVAFTREVLHLPASAWPYVGQAVWAIGERISEVSNAAAYLRKAALRLQRAADASLLGTHPVCDGHRKIIGHVTIQGYVSEEDGAVLEELISMAAANSVGAIGYVPVDGCAASTPTACAQASDRRPVLVVATDDEDEKRLQWAQRLGVSRRNMAQHLGWEQSRVEAVWKRLQRKRAREVGLACQSQQP